MDSLCLAVRVWEPAVKVDPLVNFSNFKADYLAAYMRVGMIAMGILIISPTMTLGAIGTALFTIAWFRYDNGRIKSTIDHLTGLKEKAIAGVKNEIAVAVDSEITKAMVGISSAELKKMSLGGSPLDPMRLSLDGAIHKATREKVSIVFNQTREEVLNEPIEQGIRAVIEALQRLTSMSIERVKDIDTPIESPLSGKKAVELILGLTPGTSKEENERIVAIINATPKFFHKSALLDDLNRPFLKQQYEAQSNKQKALTQLRQDEGDPTLKWLDAALVIHRHDSLAQRTLTQRRKSLKENTEYKFLGEALRALSLDLFPGDAAKWCLTIHVLGEIEKESSQESRQALFTKLKERYNLEDKDFVQHFRGGIGEFRRFAGCDQGL